MRPTLFLAVAFGCALVAQQPAEATSYRFRLDQPTAVQRLLLGQFFDVLGACCGVPAALGPMQIVVLPEELAAFRRVAPGAILVDRGRPFHEIALQRAAAAGVDVPDANYYTTTEIEAQIDALVVAYPGLAQKVNLSVLPGGALTWEGRSIFALKVSDNVALDEDEPAIVVASQMHARELNAPVMTIGAMTRVLQGYVTDPALHALVDGNEVYFVPMMNPDGVNHVWNVDNLWRKNRRNNGTNFGVDGNRNFPFLWTLCGGSTVTSSETYRGPTAASEPETQTMRNFINRLRPELYLDFHSFGQDVLNLYPPCATVSPAYQAFNTRYVDDLRGILGYSFRAPSASGEAPHDHWASGGTLSYLVEVGTDFQPLWSLTQAEENIVWPGTRRLLTGWHPAVRGHVRGSQLQQPLAAEMTFAPNQFSHGEVQTSRSRDGRYALWLPLGTWTVTWSAALHQSRSQAVTITNYDQPLTIDVELDPIWPAPTLVKSGSERIGTTVSLVYTSPGDQGKLGLMGWSLGTQPGIDLGGLRTIPLNFDFLMQSSLAGNPVLAPTFGILDGSARMVSFFALPNDAFVIGLTTYCAGITSDPTYSHLIQKWSPAVSITPLP
ncbi:MAG: M14 family zinc carboxypeptidase [Planctomycetota bacterium]|nr:M14 family zinc carboxypeptidase [Planctomycetota bacterium]